MAKDFSENDDDLSINLNQHREGNEYKPTQDIVKSLMEPSNRGCLFSEDSAQNGLDALNQFLEGQ